MKPDYYLVLPWHFLDEFLERERAYLEGSGRFVVPLPEVRVIGEERFSTGRLRPGGQERLSGWRAAATSVVRSDNSTVVGLPCGLAGHAAGAGYGSTPMMPLKPLGSGHDQRPAPRQLPNGSAVGLRRNQLERVLKTVAGKDDMTAREAIETGVVLILEAGLLEEPGHDLGHGLGRARYIGGALDEAACHRCHQRAEDHGRGHRRRSRGEPRRAARTPSGRAAIAMAATRAPAARRRAISASEGVHGDPKPASAAMLQISAAARRRVARRPGGQPRGWRGPRRGRQGDPGEQVAERRDGPTGGVDSSGEVCMPLPHETPTRSGPRPPMRAERTGPARAAARGSRSGETAGRQAARAGCRPGAAAAPPRREAYSPRRPSRAARDGEKEGLIHCAEEARARGRPTEGRRTAIAASRAGRCCAAYQKPAHRERTRQAQRQPTRQWAQPSTRQVGADGQGGQHSRRHGGLCPDAQPGGQQRRHQQRGAPARAGGEKRRSRPARPAPAGRSGAR